MFETFRATFDDSEYFLEQMGQWGWQGEIRRSVVGRFQVDLALCRGRGFIATRTRHSLANVRRIATPENARTFGLVIPNSTSNTWCSRSFDQIVVQMMPRSDYAAANAAGHTGYQVAFDDELVAETLEQLELPDTLDQEARLMELDQANGLRLARSLEWLARGSGPTEPHQQAEDVLAALLERCVPSKRAYGTRSQGRHRAFREARAYLDQHFSDPITLADLSRVVGVSRRCLTQAFRENLGISPMVYLKIVRLHRVYDQLKRPLSSELTIADVANAAGFWHMGQFARDYGKLFGERPSETQAGRRSETSPMRSAQA